MLFILDYAPYNPGFFISISIKSLYFFNYMNFLNCSYILINSVNSYIEIIYDVWNNYENTSPDIYTEELRQYALQKKGVNDDNVHKNR